MIGKDGRQEFSIYLVGDGEVELDKSVVVKNLQTLLQTSAVKILDDIVQDPKLTKVVKVPEKVTEGDVDKEDEVQDPVGDPEVPENKEVEGVVCDICGETFKSERGLKTHKRIKHPDSE